MSDSDNDNIPKIGRTVISTVARVPENKSLLIGGYTKGSDVHQERKIPFLGNIPLIGRLFRYNASNQSDMVRLFMIQPREITENEMNNAQDVKKNINKLKSVSRDSAELTDEFIDTWIDTYLSKDK